LAVSAFFLNFAAIKEETKLQTDTHFGYASTQKTWDKML
jgi:hypothetical protein